MATKFKERSRQTTELTLDSLRVAHMTSPHIEKIALPADASVFDKFAQMAVPPDVLGEHLYLSASVDAGEWKPRKDGLGPKDFSVFPEMFRYCEQYAKSSGGLMPPLQMLRGAFPNLVYVQGVDKHYAADRLTHANGIKQMYRELRSTADMLAEGRFTEAVEYIGSVSRRIKRVSGGVDLSSVTESNQGAKLPSLYEAISAAGGLRQGHYAVVAGRPGDGKSWRLMQHAVDLAVEGRRVVFFSLEMNVGVCAERFHHIMFGRQALNLPWEDRAKLVKRWWAERGDGRIIIRDPSDGPVSPLTVSRTCEEGDIAIIDYQGLMATAGGSRSIEDWRTAALISNELRVVSLADGITVISGVQLNRAAGNGENISSNPTLSLLAQTDAIGQDADLAMILRKPAPGVTVNHIVKSRHGATGGKWFSRFDPVGGRFDQVDLAEALDIINDSRAEMEQ